MTMLLNEQIHYSVNGSKDMLDKLRQFAIAQGWTADYYETNKEWDSVTPYGWKSGSKDHLQLFSSGYGNQNMIYRFRTYNRTSGQDLFDFRSVEPSSRNHSLVTASPLEQDVWNIGFPFYYSEMGEIDYNRIRRFSLPDGTFDLYLYGNEKVIFVIAKVSTTTLITFTFGTFDLFRDWQSTTELNYLMWPQWYYGDHISTWSNILNNKDDWKGPYGAISDIVFVEAKYQLIYWEAAGRPSTHLCSSYGPLANSAINGVPGYFNKALNTLVYNSFTNKRVAFNATFFIKNDTTNAWYPLGLSPMAYVNGLNLEIGDQIDFGSETYRCFPLGWSGGSNIWQAYRIV